MKIIKSILGVAVLCGLVSTSAMASSLVLCPSASTVKGVHFSSTYTSSSGDVLVYTPAAVEYKNHHFVVGMGPFKKTTSDVVSKANGLLPSITESISMTPIEKYGTKVCVYETSDADIFVMAAVK